MITAKDIEKYTVCKSEFLWMAGKDVVKYWYSNASPEIRLTQGKKFSDFEYIAVLLSNDKGISTFHDEVWRLSEWIAISEDPSREPFMPYVYLSDTTWKKNFGSQVRIHAIIGRETAEGLRDELERTRKGYYNISDE